MGGRTGRGAPDEAEVALLDELLQAEALPLVPLSDAHDQPQVAHHQPVARHLAALEAQLQLRRTCLGLGRAG